jgi:hypothetical protein
VTIPNIAPPRQAGRWRVICSAAWSGSQTSLHLGKPGWRRMVRAHPASSIPYRVWASQGDGGPAPPELAPWTAGLETRSRRCARARSSPRSLPAWSGVYCANRATNGRSFSGCADSGTEHVEQKVARAAKKGSVQNILCTAPACRQRCAAQVTRPPLVFASSASFCSCLGCGRRPRWEIRGFNLVLWD